MWFTLSGEAGNDGMHPTADTTALMYLYLAGRRVMPGVMRIFPDES